MVHYIYEGKTRKKYIKENGKIPFDEWFFKLDKSLRNTVAIRIARAQLNLYGQHRILPNKIVELKFNNGLRLYFADVENEIILLLTGGNKQRQSNDIKQAQEYLKNYKERAKIYEN